MGKEIVPCAFDEIATFFHEDHAGVGVKVPA